MACHVSNGFYSSLRKQGANKRTGGALSEKSILEHHRLISLILKKAVDEGVLPTNVASAAESPKIKKKSTPRYFRKDMLIEILTCAKQASLRDRLIINLLATIGCRKGELLGLTFGDIDLSNGNININKAVLYTKKMGVYIDSTKGCVERSNAIPKNVIDLVLQYKEKYISYRDSFADWHGSDNLDDCFLFVQSNGNPMHPDTITNILRRFAKKHNLGKINAHAFRHTYASLLILNGVDIVTVSTLMGHAEIATTMRYYSHLMNNTGKVSQAHMGALLKEIE